MSMKINQNTNKKRKTLIVVNPLKEVLTRNIGNIDEEDSRVVWNHRRALMHMRRILAWALKKHIKVLLIMPPEDLRNPENSPRLIRYALRYNPLDLPADTSLVVSKQNMNSNRQIIFRSRSIDAFEEPAIDKALSYSNLGDVFVMGVGETVRLLCLGLLQRNKKVTVIKDASRIASYRTDDVELRKIWAKGADLIFSDKLTGGKTTHLKSTNACKCNMCVKALYRSRIREVEEPEKVEVAVLK